MYVLYKIIYELYKAHSLYHFILYNEQCILAIINILHSRKLSLFAHCQGFNQYFIIIYML